MAKVTRERRLKKRTKRTTRKTKKGSRKIKGGGCGCNNVMKGGNINPTSFDGNLPLRYFYGQNDYMNDPSTAAISSRNLPPIIKGGKRRVKKSRMMKGGDMLLGEAYSGNPLVSFGTLDGARNSVDLLYGNSTVNPSVYNQPSLNGHNSNNPPLA